MIRFNSFFTLDTRDTSYYKGFLFSHPSLLPLQNYKDSIYKPQSLEIMYIIHFRRKQRSKSWIYKWQKRQGPSWKCIFFQIKLCNGNNCACQAKVHMHQEQRSWLPNDGVDQQVSSLVGVLPAYADMLLTNEQICYPQDKGMLPLRIRVLRLKTFLGLFFFF